MRDSGWIVEKFDRRAATYDQSAIHRWQAGQAVEFLAPGGNQRVLDVATGTGLAARSVADRLGTGGAVVGMDVSLGMLRQARRATGAGRCWFARADAAALPFSAGVFDAVLCVAAVPYFPDPAASLTAWRRVCRPSAHAVITVPAVDGIPSARLLRQASAGEGVELADPGGPLAAPEQRDRVAAAGGWVCEQASEVIFDQTPAEAWTAFGFIDSGFAEPLRRAPEQIRGRVWSRFETLYGRERVEQHRVVLLRLRALVG